MSISKEVLGKKIKIKRKELNLSQEKLGEKVDVSAKQICSYENGHQYPSTNTLHKLCIALKCDLGYLLDESDYRNGTKLRTSIEETMGLTNSSIDTLISIKEIMHGRYLSALNTLLSQKEPLLAVLSSLQELACLEQDKSDRYSKLVLKYGEELICEAKSRESDRVTSQHNPSISDLDNNLLEAMSALDVEEKKDYETDSISILAAKYKVFESLILLINSLYPNNSLKNPF